MNLRAALLAGAALLGVVGACAPADSGSLGQLPTGRTGSAAPSATTPSPPSTPPPIAPSGTASEPPATPAPSSLPSTPQQPGGTTGAPTRTITVEIWYVRDDALAPTGRTRPVTAATARLALAELAAGPTAEETLAGFATTIPDTLGFEVGISDGVASVDLPASFFAGGSEEARLRMAQVVYTLTQFPTVSKVALSSDGTPIGASTGRDAYADLLPPIVVTGPVVGVRVTSPVTIAGTANVFEATVSIRILDSDGAEIATTFTTATCGTGCRGDYAVAVPYQLSDDQPGTIQVYEVSAADGSRVNVVDIPVRLAASR